jgi:hypothetical protein
VASNTEIDWSGLPDTQAGAGGSGVDFSGLPDAQTGPRGGSHADLVTQSLQDYGAPPKVQAALLGDIQQESNFHPTMSGDRGTSFGLMQVGGPMFRQFNEDQARKGISPGDPEYTYNQAPFILDRFKRQHPDRWDAMQNAESAPEALKIFRGTKDWGYGIAGKRYQYAQNYEQALSGAPVQQVDTYTRVEKAVPVQEVEHEVARAYPVNGPRPPLPGGPDTLNAPPAPTIDWSGLPDAGAPTGVAPASIAAPEGPFAHAAAVVPEGVASYMPPGQVAPTETGVLPQQPVTGPGADERALVEEFVKTPVGQQVNRAAGAVANMVKSELRVPTAEEIASRMIPGMGSYALAQIKGLTAAAEGKSAEEVARTTIPEYNLFEQARKHDVGSQEWWDAVLPLGVEAAGFLAGGLGMRGGGPKAGLVAAEGGAAAGEAGAAAGEAGTAAAAGEAGVAGVRPKFNSIKEELSWLAKNDPAEFQRRFAEEVAKRQQGEYKVRTDTEPVSGAAPKPATAQPTAAAPEPAATQPTQPTAAAPETPAAPVATGPVAVPEAITEELAARGHSPAAIAALTPGQAANLVLQPAPDETVAGTAATTGQPTVAAGVSPAAAPESTAFPPPAPGEQAGSAWHGVPFLSADPLKAALASMGHEPAAIDAMTRSQLTAAMPAIEAARQQPPATTAPATDMPAIDFSGLPDQEGPPAYQPGDTIEYQSPSGQWLTAKIFKGQNKLTGQPQEPVVTVGGSQFADGKPRTFVKTTLPAPNDLIPIDSVRPKTPKAKPLTKAQKIAQDEARKEMEAAGEEAIRAQGGMELIEAVTHEGALPVKGHPDAHHYRGELKMLRETIRGSKGVRYRDIFSSKSGGVDPLVLRLRARGFNFETPDDLLNALDHRIRTGTKHWALPEAGEAMHGPAAVGEGAAPYAPRPLSLKDTRKVKPTVWKSWPVEHAATTTNPAMRREPGGSLWAWRSADSRNVYVYKVPETAAVGEGTGGYADPAKQWYHGTPAGKFEQFKQSEGGIYFTSNPDLARAYTQHRGLWLSKSETPAVHTATLDLKNPLVIDAMGTRHDNLPVPWQQWKPKVFGNLPKNAVSIRDAVKYAKDHGHDGLIVRNVIDTLDPGSRVKSDVSVAFSLEQIKPAGVRPVEEPTPAPYGEGNPVPAANTVKLAEDIQTFLDFNKVPPARKAQATEEIKNTLALAGDPALQAFYEGGFYGVPGKLKAEALRANKNRLSIVIHDLISHQIPAWNIEGSIIATPADFAMAVGPIRSPDFESFKVVARDPVTKRVLGAEITSVGTLDQALLNPRDVFRLFARIKEKHPNAEIIVSHNHPSGKPDPSDPDKNVQRRLHEAAAAVGVKLADHIITNGKHYFSFEQEEVTGDGYGTLPNPVLQPWEVVRQEESPAIRSPEDLANFTVTLRADDPNAVHIFYTGTQMNLKALERVSQGTNLAALKAAVSNGIARESAYGVLLDFARVPPANVITSLVNMVHDVIGAKFVDASWPGMDSVRAAGTHGVRRLTQDETGYITEAYGGTSPLQRTATGQLSGNVSEAGAGGVSGASQVPQLQPLSEMESAKLQILRAQKASLTRAGKRDLARLEARLITQGDLLAGKNDVFNLNGEEVVDYAARQAEADAAEAVRVAAQQAAEKAQMTLFEKPSMPYVTGTARVNESNGGGSPPYGPAGASMFSGNTPPRSNPMPIWAKRSANKMLAWWQDMLPRSYEIVRKVPESPVISEHQKLMERELAYVQNFTKQPWWQALRRRTEEEIVDLEHAAVTTYRRLLAQGAPRDAAWAQAVSQAPPDLQALFQYREGRVPTERWAAGVLGVDEPAYTGDPYIARLTNEEGKAVVDLHPQIANWGRHIRQSIGSFDKSRVHATMKEGIQAGTQYEPPTLAAFVRELYSGRLENTARMLKRLKDEGVLFDEKADAIAAARTLKKSAGPVTLVRGFGGKDYWARSRVEAQFLAQNLNTTSSAGAVGKLVRVANAFTRNPNLLYNPLPHATKNMAFKYALARVGNYTLRKSAREFGTNAQMQARFEAVMPMPSTGMRLPQLRALEAGTYLERMLSKAGKILSGNHFSARFNFAKADPALRYALWKTYVKKGMSDQAAANHVWVDLIRYDENSGALNFWRGIPLNFFATWRLGTYVSLAKQLRSHPLRSLLFIGAVEYMREILYRKYGWWTHLPVDYVDAPLASAIQDPRTIPGVAATTLLFGPGGGQAPSTIQDLMKTLHGDPGQMERVVNMFWGLSQIWNMPQQFAAYLKDKNPEHLALILSSAAFSTHSALKYNPHRLMQWLPEWMPGLEKSAIVRRAEGMQAKIQATQEKARTTYEARHGISQSLEYETPEGQMRALERAAGVHPPKPGPPRRTKVLPTQRSSGKPRGF